MSLSILSKKEAETVCTFVKLFSAALEGCSGLLGERPYVVVAGLRFLTWRKVIPVVELFCVFNISTTDTCKQLSLSEDYDIDQTANAKLSWPEYRKAAHQLLSEELHTLLSCRIGAFPAEICGTVMSETSGSIMALFHFRNGKASSLAIALTPIISGAKVADGSITVTLLQGVRQVEWEDPEQGARWLLMPPPFNRRDGDFSWEMAFPSAFQLVADFKRLASPTLLLAYLTEMRQWSAMGVESPNTAIAAVAKSTYRDAVHLIYKKDRSIFRVSRLEFCEVMPVSVLSAKEVDTAFAFMKLLNKALEDADGHWCEQPYTVLAGLRFVTMKQVVPVVDIFYILNRPFQDGSYKIALSKDDIGYFNYYRTAVKCGLKPATYHARVRNFVIELVGKIIKSKMEYLPSDVTRIFLSETSTSLVVNFQFQSSVTPTMAIVLTPAIAGTGMPAGANKALQEVLKEKDKQSWWYLIPPPLGQKLSSLSWELVFPGLSRSVKDSTALVSTLLLLQYMAEIRQWPKMGLQNPDRSILSLALWMDPDHLFLLANAPLQEQMSVLLENLQDALKVGYLRDYVVPTRNYLGGITSMQRTRFGVELKKCLLHLTAAERFFGSFIGRALPPPVPKYATVKNLALPPLKSSSLLSQMSDKEVQISKKRSQTSNRTMQVTDKGMRMKQRAGANGSEIWTSASEESEVEKDCVVKRMPVANCYHNDFPEKVNNSNKNKFLRYSSSDVQQPLALKEVESNLEVVEYHRLTFVMITVVCIVVVTIMCLTAMLSSPYTDDLTSLANAETESSNKKHNYRNDEDDESSKYSDSDSDDDDYYY